MRPAETDLSYHTKIRPTETPSGSLNGDHTGFVEMEDFSPNSKNSGYDNMEFYIDNYYEYEPGNKEPIVKGRLKAAIDFWKGN